MACSELTRPHSAHSTTPYAAFSTLQPTSTRPSSATPAAPTGKWEYGAYARRDTSTAASRSAVPVELVGHRHSLTYGSPSAAGARTFPTRPATATIVAM